MIKTSQNKHDFAYSIALIRTLETLLLNENEVDRMMLAKNVDDAFKIFNETDYADNTSGVTDPSKFQKVISEGMVDIKKIISKITPDDQVLGLIWLDYDFHNIKTMIKAKLSGKPYEEIESLLSQLGSIEINRLQQFIFEGVSTKFNLPNEHTEEYIKKKIIKVQELFEKGISGKMAGQNPQIIDLYLDQKLMKIMHGIAQDSNSQFLQTYVQKLIDLTNINLFFRMKSQEKDPELYDLAFLWNGGIAFTKFSSAYKNKLSDFPEAMKSTAYSDIVSSGYDHYEKENTFIYLEKEIENHLVSYIKRAKLMPFGPEALISYFLAKKNNALIIRMILIHKLNEIDPEEIRGRLRELYN